MNSSTFYRTKRSCIHNVRITRSNVKSTADLPEGLVIPREMMRVADISPYEQINVTKIGGSNWVNRMYTFAIPGDGDQVEARGAIAHLLEEGELCCIITTTQLDSSQYKQHVNNQFKPSIIDVRLHPREDQKNDLSDIKILLERQGQFDQVADLASTISAERQVLPRVMLSNLLTGLTIETVEKRGCIEMSAELPIEYMRKAGFCNAQSIVVYNASRGGASAESYVVPSLTKKTIGISGALTAVADVGDKISQAAYATTFDLDFRPVIHNLPA